MRVLLLESVHEDALELLMDAVEISFADRPDADSVAQSAAGCAAIITRGLLGAAQLAGMRPGALLVNTARGVLIDEEALYRALTDGPLAGAGLDALAREPPPDDHPLLRLDNVLISPHIATITDAAYRAMCVDAVTRLLLNTQPPTSAEAAAAGAAPRRSPPAEGALPAPRA